MPSANDKALLVPVGGGDPIPLVRARMTLGRRESCDICLRFPNVSGQHCEVSCQDGMWYIRDLGSTNGIKVNGERVQQKLLRPGDEIGIAKRRFTIQYVLPVGRNFIAEDEDLRQSLLEKAGLQRPAPTRKYDDE
ncbi:MAG: FHA domain-containing protein [Planctomycetia bacterium]|nr:FHA domain-containing protein [Planctomycetia bacterium]